MGKLHAYFSNTNKDMWKHIKKTDAYLPFLIKKTIPSIIYQSDIDDYWLDWPVYFVIVQ